jgi:mono/diheme cytochrome c family protein
MPPRAAQVILGSLIAATAGAGPSAIYDRYCLACHGEGGGGKGPAAAWLSPAPRDFTTGRYKWRSTPSGQPPTDADLARAIARGAPGTSMPGFGGILSEAQIAALVAEVKSFAPARFAAPAAAVPVPARPDALPDGKALFGSLGCAKCHGAAIVPRRGGAPEDIVTTLVTGLDGSAMPSYAALAPAELWAVATHAATLVTRPDARFPGPVPSGAKGPPAGLLLAAQGEPPPSLPPAAASLSADQCARCHPRQHREWRRSVHARAISPGVTGQLHGLPPAVANACLTCHAPLAEQRSRPELRAEGVSCAGCHVRAHTRRGPPRSGRLLAIPSYPLVEDPAYERADFCLPCHQLGPELALAGRPMLDTYREWLTGPYMRRGVQCQHCHMPEREHSWKGIHDPETVRQGLRVTARRDGDRIAIRAENAGAGHHLPTTPTPAIYVTVEPAAGGAARTHRIGRHVTFDGRFREVADTRLAPGAALDLSVAARGRARVRVTVAPDDYYEGFYRQLLAKPLTEGAKRELQAALRRAESSRYVLYELMVD